MQTISVSNRREFIDAAMEGHIGDNEDVDIPLSKEGADELWKIWEYRYKNGATDDYLIFVPEWMANNDFGRQWPYLFAGVEYDDDSKGAVLFRDARMIDPSIVENQVWSQVSLSDVVETLDLSGDNDFVDDPGKVWIARSQMTVFEMVEEDE